MGCDISQAKRYTTCDIFCTHRQNEKPPAGGRGFHEALMRLRNEVARNACGDKNGDDKHEKLERCGHRIDSALDVGQVRAHRLQVALYLCHVSFQSLNPRFHTIKCTASAAAFQWCVGRIAGNAPVYLNDIVTHSRRPPVFSRDISPCARLRQRTWRNARHGRNSRTSSERRAGGDSCSRQPIHFR